MSAGDLECNYNAVYSLLLKPYISSSRQWKAMGEDVENLAKSLKSYCDYLKEQSKAMSENHKSDTPVKTIAKDAKIEHRCPNPFGVNFLKEEYSTIDRTM